MSTPLVDTRLLRPLPKVMWGTACSSCDKMQANWSFHDQPQGSETSEIYPVCSLCFLYESSWGRTYKDDIEDLLQHSESVGSPLLRTNTGRLLHSKDGDGLLGRIALKSQIIQSEFGRSVRTAKR